MAMVVEKVAAASSSYKLCCVFVNGHFFAVIAKTCTAYGRNAVIIIKEEGISK